jgi:hypothetical protein
MNTSYADIKYDLLSEKAKEKKEYLIEQIDLAISELVYDKDHLRKAYNYYNGKRDREQFQHLEKNYGIGTPTSIEFIPLVRSHIDVLIGEHLSNKIKPYITCKDKETLSKINDEKKTLIITKEIDLLKRQLNENLAYATTPKEDQQQESPEDLATEKAIQKLKEDLERDFISEFEISAHYVLKNLIQNRLIDLYSKLKLLYLDLLVAGQCYYKTKIKRIGDTPELEVMNPFDTFLDKNKNSMYANKSVRGVHRRWLNKQQILSEYGKHMDNSDLEELTRQLSIHDTHNIYYIRSQSGGIISNTSITVDNNRNHNYNYDHNSNLIPVYEVEWIAVNEIETELGKEYREDRYAGVRIGETIYVNMGKAEHTIRSMERPLECTLSINGITFEERGIEPYSLVLMTANLQDKYDILHFYRDQLIASSGTRGTWADMSQIPKYLGHSESERLMKWLAYKKTGVALLDSTQEGAGNLNTIFQNYDDTVPGQAIQAIQFAIQSTAETVSVITGVFRERIGGIEQKDAVTNVQVGIKQSAIITKQYFHMMDMVTKELLIDLLNMCKISYKEGKTGTVILGNKMQQMFTIDPNKFSFTDYDVHIADAGEMIKDIETIKGVTVELIKAGTVDIDVVLEALTSESLTEMKENVSRSYKQKMQENSQLQQASAQIEQMNKQMMEMKRQLDTLNKENQTLKQNADALRTKEVEGRLLVERERNDITRDANDKKHEIDKEKVELEKLQLFDNNPFNNETKF